MPLVPQPIKMHLVVEVNNSMKSGFSRSFFSPMEKIMSTIASYPRFLTLTCLVLCTLFPTLALAAGIDTGEAAMTSIQSWLNTWIPIACAICIMVCAFAWILHLISIAWAVRVAIGLIFIGSASYLVSLLGVS